MTEIALGATYKVDCQEGNIIEFLKQVHTVCFESDDGGLSFGPHKQVVAVESMNNYRNNKPHDSHGFKKEVKNQIRCRKGSGRKVPKQNRSDD